MTVHIATVDGVRLPSANETFDATRQATVSQMATHLLAGITAGLDLSSDFDVIRYLKDTPEDYRASVITSCMDDAIYDARQTLIAATMGRG
jgi:hypothetical protein